jgi:hypothetical protein
MALIEITPIKDREVARGLSVHDRPNIFTGKLKGSQANLSGRAKRPTVLLGGMRDFWWRVSLGGITLLANGSGMINASDLLSVANC